MKFIIDFFPTLVFFVVFKWSDIFVATIALIGATTLQLLCLKLCRYSIEKMHWITFGFVVFFGMLTLVFHNDQFIKLKVTFIYGLFASILFISSRFYQKNILQSMLGKEITASAGTWRTVNNLWIGCCVFCAIINLFIAYQFSQETWVHFKLLGLTGITLLCSVITGILLLQSQRSTSL